MWKQFVGYFNNTQGIFVSGSSSCVNIFQYLCRIFNQYHALQWISRVDMSSLCRFVFVLLLFFFCLNSRFCFPPEEIWVEMLNFSRDCRLKPFAQVLWSSTLGEQSVNGVESASVSFIAASGWFIIQWFSIKENAVASRLKLWLNWLATE